VRVRRKAREAERIYYPHRVGCKISVRLAPPALAQVGEAVKAKGGLKVPSSARLFALAAGSLLLVLIAGCGGEEAELETTPAATATSVATATEPVAPQATATTQPSASTTPLSAEEVRDRLGRATILIDDLDPGYVVSTDEYADNAKASTDQPDPAQTLVFLDGCGRVLGRTVVYLAEDVTQAALIGQPVSFFSNVNAFEYSAGAAEYYTVSLGMISTGAGVTSQFAEVFADPDDVQVVPVLFSSVGDESEAFSLTGETEAEGQLYPIEVLLVTLRRGQATAFIGSIRVGLPPDVQEMETLARLLVDRLDQEF
jgi:hypothetical protein